MWDEVSLSLISDRWAPPPPSPEERERKKAEKEWIEPTFFLPPPLVPSNRTRHEIFS